MRWRPGWKNSNAPGQGLLHLVEAPLFRERGRSSSTNLPRRWQALPADAEGTEMGKLRADGPVDAVLADAPAVLDEQESGAQIGRAGGDPLVEDHLCYDQVRRIPGRAHRKDAAVAGMAGRDRAGGYGAPPVRASGPAGYTRTPTREFPDRPTTDHGTFALVVAGVGFEPTLGRADGMRRLTIDYSADQFAGITRESPMRSVPAVISCLPVSPRTYDHGRYAQDNGAPNKSTPRCSSAVLHLRYRVPCRVSGLRRRSRCGASSHMPCDRVDDMAEQPWPRLVSG